MSRFNGYLRSHKKAQDDPIVNRDWRELKVGDLVQSVVDSSIQGELGKIEGAMGYLKNNRNSFSLRTLQKVEKLSAAK